jgi:hypothetical protein
MSAYGRGIGGADVDCRVAMEQGRARQAGADRGVRLGRHTGRDNTILAIEAFKGAAWE